jgi:hypothetical protein
MYRGFQTVLIHETPIISWAMGVLMTGGGVFIANSMPDIWVGIVFAVVGLLLFFLHLCW